MARDDVVADPKNLSKRSHDQRNDGSFDGHSYTKMLIESSDQLSKSQAISFLQQASSIDSKLSLLDAMKDAEIEELIPSADASSFDTTSSDNLSHWSCSTGQARLSHLFNSFNNAAQSSRTAASVHKRPPFFRHLFGRSSSRKRGAFAKPSTRISLEQQQKRRISAGDQIKPVTTKSVQFEQQHRATDPQGDATVKKDEGSKHQAISCEGLRYDFQRMKNVPVLDQSPVQAPSKSADISTPLTSNVSFVPNRSVSSVTNPISTRQYSNERHLPRQSLHNAVSALKFPRTNSITEKALFNGNQHRYQIQTPMYQQPKRIASIELSAKHYSASVIPRANTGLFWYAADQTQKNRPVSFVRHHENAKRLNRSKSSSESFDTSSSSSATTSSSTSTTHSSHSTDTTHSSTDQSTSSTEKTNAAPYNQNQNETKNDLVRVDLNSTSSGTSISIRTRFPSHYQCSTSQKQLSIDSDTEDGRSHVMNTLALPAPNTNDLFSNMYNPNTVRFTVKRKRLELDSIR